ncbi:MAG: CsgG/HfaB family protein [Maricaulaceae bacterium]
MISYIRQLKEAVSFAISGVIFMLFTFSSVAHAQDANKAVIGIGEITSSIRGADPYSFQTMLETQLIKTNKFTVIERNRLAEVLKEQGMSQAGLIDSDLEIGGIEGIDYLVYGSITKLGATGSSIKVQGFRSGSGTVEMAMDIRIVDVENGEIRLAESIEEKIKGKSAVAVRGFSNSDSEGDPLADVQRLVATSITGLVVTNLYPAKIAAVQSNGVLILNYGDSVFAEGDKVAVYEKGEGFTDPDTGEVLGAEETQVALLEVVDTQSKFSKAEFVDGVMPKRGDIVRKLSSKENKRQKKKKKKKRKKI